MQGCYAVIYNNNTVKFGRSATMLSRLKTHVYNAKVHGVAVDMILVAPANDIESMEKRLLASASDSGLLSKVSAEYFSFVNISDAVDIMSNVFSGYFTVEIASNGGINALCIVPDGPTVRDSKVNPTSDSEKWDQQMEKVLKTISRKGGISHGILVNRYRNTDTYTMKRIIDDLEASGKITISKRIHPRNGTVLVSYTKA